MYNTWIQKDDGSHYFVTTYKTGPFSNFAFYKPAYQSNSEIYTKQVSNVEDFLLNVR